MEGFAQIGNMFTSTLAPGESGGVPTGGDWFGGDLGNLATTLRLAGAVGSGVSGYMSSSAQAGLASQNATASRVAASLEAQRYARDAKRRFGASVARAGASGTQLTGSVMDVLADQAAEEEMNRQLILYGGEVQAARSKAQAGYYKQQASATLLSGLTAGAADTLPRLLE